MADKSMTCPEPIKAWSTDYMSREAEHRWAKGGLEDLARIHAARRNGKTIKYPADGDPLWKPERAFLFKAH